MNIFTDNPDFYPTPTSVIEQMMMGEDFIGKTILEPSAGKGNIVDWLKGHGAGQVIACENDPNIRKLLDGKCEVIANDFLTVTPEMVSHIDMIVMNPPFSKGAEHILHAYEIAPPGCTITALCNSETVNGYSRYDKNQRLIELIENEGRAESLGAVFEHDAERRTRCYVSMVKLYKHGEGDNEFAGYFFSQFDEDMANANQREGIMPYNFIRELVNRYVSAVKMFDDVMEATKRINEAATYVEYVDDVKSTGEPYKRKVEYGYLPVQFKAVTSDDRATTVSHSGYRKALQKYYWRIIFDKLNMQKYATSKLHEQINKFIEDSKNAPFTMANIYRIIDIVIQTTGQRMMSALEEAFDTICSFSAENSGAGEKWKTNANYMVNRKFIVPWMTEYEHYGCKEEYVRLSYSGNRNKMEDVCKALCYLTGVDYDSIKDLSTTAERTHMMCGRYIGQSWGEWFDWGFFRCKAYKKGTMHFEFLDEEVWERFNYEVAVYKSKTKGWDLPKKTQKERKKPERKKKEAAPMTEPDGQLVMFGELQTI